jgi:hypothetical protein
MTIFKNNEKPTLEQLMERLEKLEKRVGFIVIPAITTLLDEGPFGNRRGMGGPHPLIFWIIAKLRDSPDTLAPEARDFLTELLEKYDFGSHRPLRR